MSAGVSRSRASEASSSTANGTPASRAAATWRAQLPSPKAGRIASGGEQDERVGAGPVAVGDDRDVALGHAGQQPVELARVEQRAVAGQQHDAVGARLERRGDPEQRRLGVAVVGRVGDHLGAGRGGDRSAAAARR